MMLDIGSEEKLRLVQNLTTKSFRWHGIIRGGLRREI
jgi:hypothetical protein